MDTRSYSFTTESVEQTREAAANLARVLEPGAVILLDGDLGAGKTHFTQGLAAGLGIASEVTSPTFNLLFEYRDGRLPLYHFDLYRLEDALELEDIGFYEFVEADGVACIEWAAKFPDDMPDERIALYISTGGEVQRRFDVEASGEAAIAACEAWLGGAR